MIKFTCADDFLLTHLLDLFYSVWKEKSVAKDWANACVGYYFKREAISQALTIEEALTLLDMIGKVVVSIIRTILQNLAEEVLLELQCGFGGSRSCTDMIFTVRQFIDKS